MTWCRGGTVDVTDGGITLDAPQAEAELGGVFDGFGLAAVAGPGGRSRDTAGV